MVCTGTPALCCFGVCQQQPVSVAHCVNFAVCLPYGPVKRRMSIMFCMCLHTHVSLIAWCGCRYRGYIERVSPTEPRFEVYFIDFGNREKLNTEDVRPLDAALSAVPAQARPACLAYVKVSLSLGSHC